MSEDLVIFGFCIGDARDDFFRNDQDVHWAGRFDVADGEYFVVFVNDFCRDLSRDDFFEKSHNVARLSYCG